MLAESARKENSYRLSWMFQPHRSVAMAAVPTTPKRYQGRGRGAVPLL